MVSRVVALRPSLPSRSAKVVPLAPPSDEDLVLRALTKDRAAEEALYRKHAAYIGGMAARLLANVAEGEDVMQESFCVALDRLPELRDPSAFRPWVASIAVSRVRKRLRRRRLFQLFGGATSEGGLADLVSVDASGEARAELAWLGAELSKLPADLRIAWSLRHIEGHSLDEAASLAGCSLATIKRRIDAVSERVRRHLGDADV